MRQEAGFTLVEVLVALVAGAILLAMLSWVVAGLAEDLHASDRQATLHQIEATAPMLSDLIEHAIPPSPDGAGLVTRPDLLSMEVPPPDALGPVGPLRMDLSIAGAGDDHRLLARFSAVDPDVQLPATVTAPQLLVAGLREVAFVYQARRHAPGPMLPALVTIVFTAADGRVYPLVAAPRINVDPACHIDQVTLACRP